jgi:hypothetical protein
MEPPVTATLHENEPHRNDVAQRLNWLRAGVLGANDGIVSVAAIVVGVAGVTTDSGPILIAGAAAAPSPWPWASMFPSAASGTASTP